ncbi:hypothetical protein BE11_40145 [Sorangium cellulosum]|nr:hypothetical protein BE11_40145 [Sorangium cellulosum]
MVPGASGARAADPTGAAIVMYPGRTHMGGSEPAVMLQSIRWSARVDRAVRLAARHGRTWQKDLVVDPLIFGVI